MGIIFSSKQHANVLVPCMEGNLDEVKRLVGIYIADQNQSSSNNSSCSSSSKSDLRAYINAIDPISGNAAIHGATFSGHLDILSFLVEAGGGQETMMIDLRLKNRLGCTPMWIAAGYERMECLQYLIEKLYSSHQLELALLEGNNTGDTPFLASASRGNIGACQCLLNSTERWMCAEDRNHDESVPSAYYCWNLKRKMLRTANCAGDTALKVAVASGQNVELLTLLLDMDNRCQEQLEKLCNDDNNEEACRVNKQLEDDTIIMHSKCINRKNNMGLSPLIVACERNLPSIVELLLHHGADICIRDAMGRSPLAVAAFCGCNDVVELLLHQVNVPLSSSFSSSSSSAPSSLLNDVDLNECTPLWLAARTGNLSMVKLLVDARADASIKNKDGMTPLDVARKFNKETVVEFLLNNPS